MIFLSICVINITKLSYIPNKWNFKLDIMLICQSIRFFSSKILIYNNLPGLKISGVNIPLMFCQIL